MYSLNECSRTVLHAVNRAMPTTERRDFVLRKARDGFRAKRNADPAVAAAAMEYAEIMCVIHLHVPIHTCMLTSIDTTEKIHTYVHVFSP